MRAIGEAVSARAALLVNAHRDSGRGLRPISSDGPVRFVVASRWNAWKGHSTLLEAWDAAGCPGELVILGGPPPVGAAVDVRKLVSNLADPLSVKVVGEVSDVEPYIDSADFLVLPSDSPEPFGLVVLEAFARGRGVIASRAGGVADIIEEGRNGCLYQIGSADDLCMVLKSVDKHKATELGANARERYEAVYSIDAYSGRFLRLWQDMKSSAHARTHG
ncbi:glycosyltransferase family 4 protein [Pseudarthrobacter sp. SL88]|uniref:glycosyltransferase family 4 protein n=1 Tax=Pseudarthrobacter sp. SL88 TaxID=2994666 RepID=UPI003FA3AD62